MAMTINMTDQKRYRTIVADPPWAYTDHNTGGSFKSGSSNHYTTMTPETVGKKLHIDDICMDDSILFLWATTPLLPEIFPIVSQWGYTYKTMITWYKVDRTTLSARLGLGHYFRGMTEHCLVCTRGKVKPFGCQSHNVIIEKPREHSRKPEAFWDLVEHALSKINPHKETGFEKVPVDSFHHTVRFNFDTNPEPRIELFCRGSPRKGWDGWGNQCENGVKLDILY